jgi:hypothetical protein
MGAEHRKQTDTMSSNILGMVLIVTDTVDRAIGQSRGENWSSVSICNINSSTSFLSFSMRRSDGRRALKIDRYDEFKHPENGFDCHGQIQKSR